MENVHTECLYIQIDRGIEIGMRAQSIYSLGPLPFLPSFKTLKHPRETLHFCKAGAGDGEQFVSML